MFEVSVVNKSFFLDIKICYNNFEMGQYVEMLFTSQ